MAFSSLHRLLEHLKQLFLQNDKQPEEEQCWFPLTPAPWYFLLQNLSALVALQRAALLLDQLPSAL